MSIRLISKTVFRCKCERPSCGYEWDTLKKPKRCARCKYLSWNGEDYRKADPFQNVPEVSKIETGATVPRQPSYKPLLDVLMVSREIVDQVIQDYGPCKHSKNQCICRERKLLADLDRQIKRFRPFVGGLNGSAAEAAVS